MWVISEALLILSVAINYLPPRLYSFVFRFSVVLLMVDFFLCLIWLPIGVSNTYGFRSAKEVFTQTCGRDYSYTLPIILTESIRQRNGSASRMELDIIFVSLISCIFLDGVTDLYSLFTSGTMTGFDASGHVAEETKNARYALVVSLSSCLKQVVSIIAGKGILSSALATGILGFAATILFLFCIPELDTFFSLPAPQPFVLVYALALGKKASIFMTIIAVLGLIMVRLLDMYLFFD